MSDYEKQLEEQNEDLRQQLEEAERCLNYMMPFWHEIKDDGAGRPTWTLHVGHVVVYRVVQEDHSKPLNEAQTYEIHQGIDYMYSNKVHSYDNVEHMKKDIFDNYILNLIEYHDKRKA